MTTTIIQNHSNFKLLDLAYDVHMAKIYTLVMWTHEHIKNNPGEFISTHELYEYYRADLEEINPTSILTELSFYKEIQEALLANKIILAKARQNGKRGFNGIKYHIII